MEPIATAPRRTGRHPVCQVRGVLMSIDLAAAYRIDQGREGEIDPADFNSAAPGLYRRA